MNTLPAPEHTGQPRKSSYCHSHGCVYVQTGTGTVRVMPEPDATTTLTFPPGQWTAFTTGIRKEWPGAA